MPMQVELVMFLVTLELVAVDEVVTLLLDFGYALLLLVFDQLAQFLFLLFVGRHGNREKGVILIVCVN